MRSDTLRGSNRRANGGNHITRGSLLAIMLAGAILWLFLAMIVWLATRSIGWYAELIS